MEAAITSYASLEYTLTCPLCIFRVAAEDPLSAHDYTEMRAEALRQMATPNGEEHLVDEAVQVDL